MSSDTALTEKIIGAAYTVLNMLKPGLDENSMSGRTFPVHYDDQLIGTLIPDLIIEDRIIVDVKVVTKFTESHLAQMLSYLNIPGFKHAKFGIKRISR